MRNVSQHLLFLREILGSAPDSTMWSALCRRIEEIGPEDGLELAIDYAVGHLERWPDALREAPEAWWSRHEAGEEEPRLALARVLDLSGRPRGKDALARMLRRFESWPLTILRARGCQLGHCDADHPLFTSPSMDKVHELDLSFNPVGSMVAQALAQSPHTSGLETLKLRRTQVKIRGLESFSEDGALPALKSLDIGALKLNDRAIRSLGGGGLLHRLEHLWIDHVKMSVRLKMLFPPSREPFRLKSLDLSLNRLSARAISAFPCPELTPDLESLSLNRNPLDVAGGSQFVSSPRSSLRRLYLRQCRLRAGGISAVLSADLPALQELDISKNLLVPGTVPELKRTTRSNIRRLSLAQNLMAPGDVVRLCGHFPVLEELDLSSCGLGPGGVEALCSGGLLEGIVRLRLADNGLNLRSMKLLAGCEELRSLRELHVYDEGLGPRSFALLSRSENLKGIERLTLSHGGLGAPAIFSPNGLKHLLSKGGLTKLKRLNLSHQQLSEAHVEKLLEAPLAGQLSELDLRGCSLTPEAAEALLRSPRMARITNLDMRRNFLGEELRHEVAARATRDHSDVSAWEDEPS